MIIIISVLIIFYQCSDHAKRGTRYEIFSRLHQNSGLSPLLALATAQCTMSYTRKKSGKFEVYLNYDTSEFKPCQPFHLWPTEFKKKFLEPLFLNVTSLSHYITSQLSTSTTMCLVFGPKVTKNTPQEKSKWVSYMTELDFKIIQQFINICLLSRR